LGQVAGDVRVVIGIDDGYGRAAAVAGNQAVGRIFEADAIEAIGVTDLDRGERAQEGALFKRLNTEPHRPGWPFPWRAKLASQRTVRGREQLQQRHG